MRIKIVDDDDYTVDTINLDNYNLDDEQDVSIIIDIIIDIINSQE